MSADTSFFKNIESLIIHDGSFNQNLQNGPVTNHNCQQTIGINYGPIYNNSVQNTNALNDVEFTFSPIESDNTIIPRGAKSQALSLLFAKAKRFMRVLPVTHLELARNCAGLGRHHATRHDIGNNVVSVVVPLFSSSLFSALPAGVQFMALYFLVSMVVLDILHPLRFENRVRPDALVKVLDALGKYHDFPWAAFENMDTFHEEYLKRSLNGHGHFFVKSRSYEIQCNGCILQQTDWKVIKPFTDVIVDFFIIQKKARMVKCPWCKSETSLPSSDSEGCADIICTCPQCGRDFPVTEAESGNAVQQSRLGHTAVSHKIRRLRIRLQSSERSADQPGSAFRDSTIKGSVVLNQYNNMNVYAHNTNVYAHNTNVYAHTMNGYVSPFNRTTRNHYPGPYGERDVQPKSPHIILPSL